jgi:hypothetical protein
MSQEPVPVGGIWLRKNFAHLGNEIEVLAEVDGCISHIVEPAGILKAQADPLPDPTVVR